MSYNYNRGIASSPAVQGSPVTRGYPRTPTTQYAPQGFYYTQPSPQQYQTAFLMQPGAPQQYQMMQYAPQQTQQQPAVYVQDDNFAQQAFLQMSMQPMQGQMRYVPPPTTATQAPPPQVAQPTVQQIETRRKVKKETQQAQPYKRQQAAIQQPQSTPTIIHQQQIFTPQQMIQPQPIVQYQEFEPIQQSLENCLPKMPSGFLTSELKSPPGCFNIIKRGNLPGLSFKQICSQ